MSNNKSQNQNQNQKKSVNLGSVGETPKKTFTFSKEDEPMRITAATPPSQRKSTGSIIKHVNPPPPEYSYYSAANDLRTSPPSSSRSSFPPPPPPPLPNKQERPKTSRGQSRPSPEQFYDYVIPSPDKGRGSNNNNNDNDNNNSIYHNIGNRNSTNQQKGNMGVIYFHNDFNPQDLATGKASKPKSTFNFNSAFSLNVPSSNGNTILYNNNNDDDHDGDHDGDDDDNDDDGDSRTHDQIIALGYWILGSALMV